MTSAPQLAEDSTRATLAPGGRRSYGLNQEWFFRREDPRAMPLCSRPSAESLNTAEWESVTVPHPVRLEPVNASGGRNFQGVCWYARIIRAESAWQERVVYLHFEGAMQVCDVWLNDQKLGTHFGGYTPFVFDITQQLRMGEDNLLVLRLDNSDHPDVPPGKPQGLLDFCYFGGLYRNVRLDVVEPLHVSDPIFANQVAGGGVLVTYPRVNAQRADVQIKTDLRNASDQPRNGIVRQEILDPGGAVVARDEISFAVAAASSAATEQTLRLDRPDLWHPDYPHLYTLRTAVIESGQRVDVIDTTIGIRRIEFTAEDGLLINGEKYFAHGANRHQDHPYVGYALSDAAQWRDAQKLYDGGFRSFRSHYPQAPAFMDACDALGILTIVSNPGWQFVGGETFRERAIANARTMVRRDRNRPSVVLWEAALNESANAPIGAALQQAVHEELPGDQCFTAGDHEPGFAVNGRQGWDVEYWQNDGQRPYWVREWGDRVDNWSDQQSANRVARGWGETPMLAQAQAHLSQMDELMVAHHGTSSGPAGRRLAGACLWAAVDCARGYHHQMFHGGVLDPFRLPKFSFYLFQSQRPVAQGAMVFIANFATFHSPTAITVFSNCEQVRLLLNRRQIAVQGPDPGHRIAHPPFTFAVEKFLDENSTMFMTVEHPPSTTAAPSELRAEGLVAGKVVATHVVRPPGTPRQLKLVADFAGRDLVADGADFVRVHAQICDRRGTVHPYADDAVQFAAQGVGTIVERSEFPMNPTPAVGGIATALVRSQSKSGRILVRASAFGLLPAELEIHTSADSRDRQR